jgi:hypothetical protein
VPHQPLQGRMSVGRRTSTIIALDSLFNNPVLSFLSAGSMAWDLYARKARAGWMEAQASVSLVIFWFSLKRNLNLLPPRHKGLGTARRTMNKMAESVILFPIMKLSEWARKRSTSYKTAWRWVRQGKMPVPFEQTPTGTILVKEPETASQAVALYARVSSADQRAVWTGKSPGSSLMPMNGVGQSRRLFVKSGTT